MARIKYDKEVDALYIRCGGCTPVAETEEIEAGIMLDLDDERNVIGIEILDFADRLRESGTDLFSQL